MTTWNVRLLGGLEIDWGDRHDAGLESRKVDALFVYLLCHPGREMSREHLGALLWPERSPESARRNLRQALYNLNHALTKVECRQYLHAERRSLSFELPTDAEIDTADFEDAVRRGLHRREPDEQALTHAAQLYRGEFLEGFSLPDSEPFDEWQATQRNRYREMAIQVLKTLSDHLQSQGETDRALLYARRVLDIDPLAEPAHRDLMKLFTVSGRRTAALSQYEELTRTLQRELGVDPDRRTREIYRSILAEEVPETLLEHSPGPTGPVIPLVGRGRAWLLLEESWQAVRDDGARLLRIEGEPGVGKTRLIKTFLHQVTSKHHPEVILGHGPRGGPPRSLEPFPELLRNAVADQIPTRVDEPQGALPALLEQIDQLLPRAAEVGAHPLEHPLAERLVRLIRSRCRTTGRPMVLLLDDLDQASRSSFRLLETILPELTDLPLWIVATGADSKQNPEAWPMEPGDAAVPVDRIRLHRLGEEALPRIVRGLVKDDAEAARLEEILKVRGDGLPLQIAEAVNLLVDEDLLVAAGDGEWALAPGAAPDSLPDGGLDALLRSRLDRLPSSTGRLFCLAALMGRRFDVETLRRAGREHMAVVEIGVEVLLERWLLRQFPRHWGTHPRERDLVLWAHGARRGTFELAHPEIRRAACEGLPEKRRRVMHRAAAAGYAEADSATPWHEETAWHLLEAGCDDEARSHLETAAETAQAMGDEETARFYRERLGVAETADVNASSQAARTRDRE